MDASPDAIHSYLRDGRTQIRVGRKLGRTLYLHFPTDDFESDLSVGIVDSEELAREIMALWNRHYSQKDD